jgi:PPOX class probable F420-dependent enzyme
MGSKKGAQAVNENSKLPKHVELSTNAERILGEPATGTLCIVDGGGMPNATPVWFLWRDGKILISTRGGRQKHVNALRAGEGSFSVIDPTNPSHYVELRGPVRVYDDPGYALRDAVVLKHGHPDGRAFDPGDAVRIVIELTPTRVLGRH